MGGFTHGLCGNAAKFLVPWRIMFSDLRTGENSSRQNRPNFEKSCGFTWQEKNFLRRLHRFPQKKTIQWNLR